MIGHVQPQDQKKTDRAASPSPPLRRFTPTPLLLPLDHLSPPPRRPITEFRHLRILPTQPLGNMRSPPHMHLGKNVRPLGVMTLFLAFFRDFGHERPGIPERSKVESTL